MENLSDVEFGSDKGEEEAPILVAQRYLNIFRQVHIFKKEKRDQFDDELLALPSNITDFFKRMPGGRLLVEHIEDVKTERGIAFVKTNRDEFTDGTEDTPSPTAVQAAVPAQVAGGNLVMDSSFAETFSQSLADAFKQIPVASGGGASNFVSADIGKSFELIAEEIRTSRSSLLDVLKETRNITDTVIASQVTISKMLESLLASQKNENDDTKDLNSRILASQTAITQLLENLCRTYNQGSSGGLSSDQLEARLFQFKQQLQAEVERSLASADYLASALPHSSSTETSSFDEKEDTQYPSVLEENLSTQSEEISSDNDIESDVIPSLSDKKKKKKKKKKNSEQLLEAVPLAQPVSENLDALQSIDPAFSSDLDNTSVIDGVIKNDEYKYDDDFNHINLNEPPLDIEDDTSLTTDYSSQPSSLEAAFTGNFDTDDDLDFVLPEQGSAISADDTVENSLDEDISDAFTDSDGLDFALPESPIISPNDTQTNVINDDIPNGLDNFIDDSDLDFSLPESVADDNTEKLEMDNPTDNLSDFISDDSLFEEDDHKDMQMQTQMDNDTSDALSSFIDDNDSNLDFSLPESVADDNAEIPETDNPTDSLTDFINDDSLFKENDHKDIQTQMDSDTSDALSSFIDDSDLDFALPESVADDNMGVQETEKPTNGLDNYVEDVIPAETTNDSTIASFNNDDTSLDNFTFDDNVDTLDNINDNDSSLSDESFPSQEEIISPAQTDNESSETELNDIHDRYSAELDKIRQALTSDNVDISSLDAPIALDDYSDDEHLSNDNNTDDDQWEYEYVEDGTADNVPDEENLDTEQSTEEATKDDDWDWEYVDENGNIIPSKDNDEDWEWEYVEDDDTQQSSSQEDENKNQ